MNKGKLFVCGTPIGNLEDISYRVLKTLKKVDIIFAEDTRHTIKLLNYFEINKKLKSYHKHNILESGEEIIKLLESGKDVALVSDAGMPGISDPGEDIIKKCIELDFKFDVIPGPTAFVIGLIQSGFSNERFAFEGFLNRSKNKKEKQLEKIKFDDRTLIFYESPHRIKKTLKSMLDILGNRNISISREITKKYEEVLRFTIEEAINYFNKNNPRGEFVLVVEGSNEEEKKITYDFSVRDHIIIEMKKGNSKKKAIKEVAKLRNLKKNEVYKESFDIDINL